MQSVVTKAGDEGSTGLFGGRRVRKDDLRICAIGAIDELNAAIGVVLSTASLPKDIRSPLLETQHMLFRLGADIATPMNVTEKVQRIDTVHVELIHALITAIEQQLPPQTSFILPGGSDAAAHLHRARTICRRAEREVVRLLEHEEINNQVVAFLNRLGDYLFVLARKVNMDLGMEDVAVRY